jgi:hypothetical protein
MTNVACTATGFVVGTLVGVTFFTAGAAIGRSSPWTSA